MARKCDIKTARKNFKKAYIEWDNVRGTYAARESYRFMKEKQAILAIRMAGCKAHMTKEEKRYLKMAPSRLLEESKSESK